MPDLDELTNTQKLNELLHRVISERKIEVVYDQEGKAAAVLGFEHLMEILEAATPQLRLAREYVKKLAELEQARVLALSAREGERLQRRELPWEAIKANPDWQQRWDTLLAEVRSQAPSDLSAEEIDAEIEAAREAVHQEQRARHA